MSLVLLLVLASVAVADDGHVWTDPQTDRVWAVSDNGSGLSLSQANRYCRDTATGGFHDWTLPTINELQRLFDPATDRDGRHIRGPIKLTGWEWSSTPGQQEGEGWVLDFGDGARASAVAGDSGLNRALCVRRSQSGTDR
jgi:Protein of unknown function (DUF1566)